MWPRFSKRCFCYTKTWLASSPAGRRRNDLKTSGNLSGGNTFENAVNRAGERKIGRNFTEGKLAAQ